MGASAITAASLLCSKILVCMRTELTIAEVPITGGRVKKDCTLEIFFFLQLADVKIKEL